MSPPTASQDVSAAVRARVRAAEISQVELGRQLGMSQPAISRRLKGGLSWRVDELEKLTSVLGCTLSDLIAPPFPGTSATHLAADARAAAS